jgi:Integrase core domain
MIGTLRGLRDFVGTNCLLPRSQLELAVVEYIAWFNNDRLHESLGDVSPAEFESLYAAPGDQQISLKMKIGSN